MTIRRYGSGATDIYHAAELPGPVDSNVVKRTCSKRSTFWNTRPELVLDNRSQFSNARAGQVASDTEP
jgi:hypothetical protein